MHVDSHHPDFDQTLRSAAQLGEAPLKADDGYTVASFHRLRTRIENYAKQPQTFAKENPDMQLDSVTKKDRWFVRTLTTFHFGKSFLNYTVIDLALAFGLITIPLKFARFYWHLKVDKKLSGDDMATTLEYLREEEIDKQAKIDEAFREALRYIDEPAQLALAQKLLDEGANPNLKLADSFVSEDALTRAIELKDLNFARKLLVQGADVNGGEIRGNNCPLLAAVTNNDMEALTLLLNEGVKVKPQHLIRASDSVNMTRIDRNIINLLKETLVLQATDLDTSEQWEILKWVDNRKDTKLIQDLLRRSTSLDFLLYKAASFNRANLIKMLIDAGADVNVQHPGDYPTALAMSLRNGRNDIYTLLVNSGADIHSEFPRDPHSVLVLAIRHASWWVVSDLIARGVVLDQQFSHDKRTALMFAAERSDSRAIEVLLQAGADWSIQDASGKTALDYCPDHRHDAYALLKEKQSQPLDPNWRQWKAKKEELQSVGKSLFVKPVALQNLPLTLSLKLASGKIRHINAAALVNVSDVFKKLFEEPSTTSEVVMGTDVVTTGMQEHTYEALESYLSKGTIVFSPEYSLDDLLDMLRALHGYQCEGAAALVEKELIARLRQEGVEREVRERCMAQARTLFRLDLLKTCQRLLGVDAESPNNVKGLRSSDKIYPRGFHGLWDKTAGQPIEVAVEEYVAELPVHAVVLANAGVTFSMLKAYADKEKSGDIKSLLQLLYTGELEERNLNEEELFRLVTLGKKLGVEAPFQARLGAVYLSAIMKNALLGDGQISLNQRKNLQELNIHLSTSAT